MYKRTFSLGETQRYYETPMVEVTIWGSATCGNVAATALIYWGGFQSGCYPGKAILWEGGRGWNSPYTQEPLEALSTLSSASQLLKVNSFQDFLREILAAAGWSADQLVNQLGRHVAGLQNEAKARETAARLGIQGPKAGALDSLIRWFKHLITELGGQPGSEDSQAE